VPQADLVHFKYAPAYLFTNYTVDYHKSTHPKNTNKNMVPQLKFNLLNVMNNTFSTSGSKRGTLLLFIYSPIIERL